MLGAWCLGVLIFLTFLRDITLVLVLLCFARCFALSRDLDGRTALHLAASRGKEAALRTLLNHQAARPKRPDPVDHLGRTPLHDAAWWGQKHTTEALLRGGAKVRRRTPPPPRTVHLSEACRGHLPAEALGAANRAPSV